MSRCHIVGTHMSRLKSIFSDFTEYEFEAFGEDAETQFLEGDWEDKVLDKYILFRRFKMELHNNPVCIATY